jgi:hypothetical protein
MRAPAVAAFNLCFAELAAGVGGSRKSERTGEQCQIERGPDGETTETAKERRRHRKRVSAGIEKKPIALGN